MESKRHVMAGGTAEVFTVLRAAGAAEPDPALRHPDYLAARLLPKALRLTTLARIPLLRRVIPVVAQRLSPGSYGYELARGRELDAALRSEIARGLPQFVLLGAGFDTRPYRFAEQLAATAVFELDHPITSAAKQRAVARGLSRPPSNVRFLSVDFESDDIWSALAAAGYHDEARTMFLWSGVSGYLTEGAVRAMFTGITEHSAADSVVIFDYWHQSLIDGDLSAYGAAQAASLVAKLGEPYRSGIDPSTLATFLESVGLQLVSDVGPAELQRRHLIGSHGTPKYRPYGFLNIARARVQPRRN